MTTINIGPIDPETGEKTPIYIEQVEIPDLWHITEALRNPGSLRILATQSHLATEQADLILQTWELANELKRFILAQCDTEILRLNPDLQEEA